MILYGIKNCNTVKKAINWLNEHKVPFQFHDYKKQGLDLKKLQEWSSQLGSENLMNRKGMTWRKLDDQQKEDVKTKNKAIEVMAEKTSLIRRPIIEKDGKIMTIGFDEGEFEEMYGTKDSSIK